MIEHGLNPKNIAIVGDDAGQFNVFAHALCWIHAARIVAKLVGFTAEHRSDLEKKRSQIWDFHRGLKEYKMNPSPGEKAAIEARFDEIFLEKTSFETLNQALKRLHRNKSELLLVLERPETPLHNNLGENGLFPDDAPVRADHFECRSGPESILRGKPKAQRLVSGNKKNVRKYREFAPSFAENWDFVKTRCTEAARFEAHFFAEVEACEA